jgi:16S rRNA (cytidine1402-2'-O)-methyltransferase
VTGELAAGTLVLVSTPIGNLGDLSPRAVETLARADVVYCEDTRRTRGLLAHAGLKGVRLLSLHGHNEMARVDTVLALLAEGRTVAVVSDAGTPAVSDPGSRLVSAAAAAGATVTAVPGPSAVLAALVVSGLATDRFCFEGFLPRRGGDRRRRVAAVAGESRTVVLFEAPGRLVATLDDLIDACGGDRPVAVARELTKLHEEVWRGTLADASVAFSGREVRGEIVVVLAGNPESVRVPEDIEVAEAVRGRLAEGDSLRDAAGQVAGQLGISRRRAYDLALELRRNEES